MSRSTGSRRERKRKRRQHTRNQADLRAMTDDLNAMMREGARPGMTRDQVLELVRHGVDQMAQRFTQEGLARRAPWGMTYQPQSLFQTLQSGLLMLKSADDEAHDPRDVDDEQARRSMFETVAGAVTLAAAAILYLESSPLPFDLARHLQISQIDNEGNRKP